MSANKYWLSWLRPAAAKSARPRLRNAIAFETLENRLQMAATDMASITGRVFTDATGNGYTAGEEVSGATVNLLLDDGDGVFEPGAGDAQVQTDLTDSAGIYRFDGLVVGNYWVHQPAQTVGADTLASDASPLVVIDATDVMGINGTTIDNFNTTAHAATAISTGPTSDSSFAATAVGEALGGERDLFTSVTSGAGMIELAADAFNQNVLEFMASATANGVRRITWDGADGDGAVLAASGLGGVDLTDAATSTAFQFVIGADQATGVVRVRVYSSATNWSEDTALIPNTGGAATQTITLPFAAFSTGGGTGGNFASVGAIEVLIDGINAVDGQLDLFGVLGPTVATENFDNFTPADLSLAKIASTNSPQLGQNVTFTVTVTNGGPNPATNVSVADSLPAGLTFVSSTPSQGAYNSGTGAWTVGTINNGANATLQIVATAATCGAKINTAQVSAADQTDADSTPGNSNAGEDDQASVTVMPQASDLSLTKIASSTTPTVGQNVTFTVTVSNAGPTTATGVAVRDQLPGGLTFVSATPSQGTYSNATGLWTIGSVALGSTPTLQIVATVSTVGDKTNTAQIQASDQTDTDSTPNNSNPNEDDQASVIVSPPVADLSLGKTIDNAAPMVGQLVLFTLTVTNAGPLAATNVVVTDLLPAGLTFNSSMPSQGSYNSGTGLWTIGTIASGSSVTLQIAATVTAGGRRMNTAQITASDQFDPDSTPGNSIAGEDDIASVMLSPPRRLTKRRFLAR